MLWERLEMVMIDQLQLNTGNEENSIDFAK